MPRPTEVSTGADRARGAAWRSSPGARSRMSLHDLGLPSETLRKACAAGRGRSVACGRICRPARSVRRSSGCASENFELRRANEILKAASVFFATELDTDRPK